MSPHTFDPDAGVLATVEAIASWLSDTGRTFLTISGGEPMDQAAALAALIDRVRIERDWIVTCYTGHRLEDLRSGGDPDVLALLARIDLLIDGAYVEARHAALRWRGSSNQRLHSLTGRIDLGPDEPAGVDVHFDSDDTFRFIGVPPSPGFAETFVDIWPEHRPSTSQNVDSPAFPFAVEECA